ncbi:MAG: hypothetical protein QXH17_05080 [Candidatus Bathyarchaeia archaeon]|nr:hypothetical protein [Candidatus Bathyarchaeota archaeon]
MGGDFGQDQDSNKRHSGPYKNAEPELFDRKEYREEVDRPAESISKMRDEYGFLVDRDWTTEARRRLSELRSVYKSQ